MSGRPWMPVAVVIVAGAVGALVGPILGAVGGSGDDEFGHFDNARSVHVAPDGRLVFADLGTGKDDGRVVVVRPGERQQVVMDHLPSTTESGQAHSDLSGPSGAAMNEAGTVCVVIGDGPTSEYAIFRCNNGLRVDLKAFERLNNPDGRSVESNPFDVAWDGIDGWVVSDAAANDVLHVSAVGDVTVLGVFWPQDSGQPEGVPTGLDYAFLGNRFRHVAFGLFGGGIGIFDLGRRGPLPQKPSGRPVVAVALNRFATSGTEEFLCTLEWDDSENGGDLVCAGKRVRSFVRPTGITQLSPGEYVVVEAGQPERVHID